VCGIFILEAEANFIEFLRGFYTEGYCGSYSLLEHKKNVEKNISEFFGQNSKFWLRKQYN
jgi:hypothetical protein